jgi:hypothetical protein
MIETLAYEGKEFLPMAAQLAIKRGYVTSHNMMVMVKEHMISHLTDIVGKEEYVSVLNNAIERSTHLNGIHVKMHNLVVIYSFFYGGFLHAIQMELCFKCIQQNPMKGHYKDHKVFAKLVYNVLKVSA